MIAIIDYGAGNMRSIEKALEHVGAEVQVTGDPAIIATTQAVVLPGVGSGGAAMARMNQRGLDDAIRQATQQGTGYHPANRQPGPKKRRGNSSYRSGRQRYSGQLCKKPTAKADLNAHVHDIQGRKWQQRHPADRGCGSGALPRVDVH